MPKKSPEAVAWWRSLSINQQKLYRDKYYPEIRMYLIFQGVAFLTGIWVGEGKPQPQKLISVPLDRLFSGRLIFYDN